MKKLYFFLICSLFLVTGLYAGETDYTKGLSIWFDTPNTLQGYAVWYGGRPDLWKGGDKPETAGNAGHNPDPAWESQSLPIGNGSLGANIMGYRTGSRRRNVHHRHCCHGIDPHRTGIT